MNNSLLHYTILKFIIEHGFAPEVNEIAEILNVNNEEAVSALNKLHEDHGVVLHPNSSKIWVIHPFSLAPTNFLVTTDKGEWWGNCGWCSLGVAALLNRDVKITTTIGAAGKQITINIIDGKIIEKDIFIHFPIPMKNAWDNVIYTCSTMLLFENENQIDLWCKNHRIPKGDIQTLEKIWEFSKVWYGNHLNPDWKKWTLGEAAEIFKQFGLTNEIWNIPVSNSRF